MQQLTIERAGLVGLLDSAGGLRGIELGVASGDYSARLWNSGVFKELWGVDAYADHHGTAEYIDALRQIGLDSNYRLLRMYFEEALELFPDEYFDFVYIDGYAHTGENAGKTLYDWHAKVRVGGLIAGHDYHEDWPLVMKAVDRFAADAGMELKLTQLTSDPGPQDKYPSWAAFRVKKVTPPYPEALQSLAPISKKKSKKRTKKDVSVTDGITASTSVKLLRALRSKVKKKLPKKLKAPLASLQGAKKGKRCLIMGSAPSVAALDLSRVRSCDLFALNRAGELCRNISSGDRMLVISDPVAVEGNEIIAGLSIFDRVFLSADIPSIKGDNLYCFEFFKRPLIYEGFAQADLTKPLYHCHTVAGFAIQIAVAMGYDEIYLVGIDLSFGSGPIHFYESSARERQWAHRISVPKTSRMQAGLAYLAHWAKRKGSAIVNLSPEPSLPMIETDKFEDVFNGNPAGKISA